MKILLLLFVLSFPVFADNVAKVIILKGEVKAELINRSMVILKKDDWLPEGATVLTAPKSYIKLVFIDKSTVSVGPESSMQISAFPREGAGVLSVIKGQIRSQVIKELDKNVEIKTKLFVKTKSAAMGVRGTDFQVIFNPENNVTSLITFEGSVAFSKMETNSNESKAALEKMITSPKSVFVNQGQYSGANPNAESVTVPTKISPAQFESMKQNINLAPPENDSAKNQQPTNYVSVVAPGLPQEATLNTESSLTKLVIAPALTEEKNSKDFKPEGFVNNETGQVQPPAGGYIDIKTGLYLPPPPGSVLDLNTNVLVIPAQFGSFNAQTGAYVPPAGLILAANGEFKVSTDRFPANLEMKAPAIIPPKITLPGDTYFVANSFQPTKNSDAYSTAPTYDREKIDQLRETVYRQLNEQTQVIQNGQVKINITVGN